MRAKVKERWGVFFYINNSWCDERNLHSITEVFNSSPHALTAMFDQPFQCGHLPLNPEALTIENKPVTISGDPSKPPNDNIKTKLKNNSTPTTQEACGSASTTSHVLKGINRLL